MSFIKRNILFVDDDPIAQAMISSMLTQAGYTVTCVEDGFAALDMLHLHAFDLLLLDIMMVKMNGLELLKRIKAQPETKDIPVIMMSARDDKQVIARAVHLGANDYMVKPPQRERFLKKLENLLGGRPRFAEVFIDTHSPRAKGNVAFAARVLSVGESGLTFWSPIQLEVNSSQVVHLPLLEEIGVKSSTFKIIHAQPENKGFAIYVNYLSLKPEEVKKIRDWVISQAFKGRTVA